MLTLILIITIIIVILFVFFKKELQTDYDILNFPSVQNFEIEITKAIFGLAYNINIKYNKQIIVTFTTFNKPIYDLYELTFDYYKDNETVIIGKNFKLNLLKANVIVFSQNMFAAPYLLFGKFKNVSTYQTKTIKK